MKPHPLRQRYISPVLTLFVVALVSYLGYYGARRLGSDTARLALTTLSGTVYFLSIFFGPLYVYTLTHLRGAPLRGRILAMLLIPFIWMSKDVLVMSQSHPLIECLYWYLNPLYIWLACLLAVEMGLGTILARWILKRRGQEIRVISLAPVLSILIGLLIFGGIFAWGQGENLFSLYLDGYRFIFGSGV
jgi:hypothetical protein